MHDDQNLCILVPSGSSIEKIKGMSHLFEHIIFSKLNYKNVLRAYTSEDYIILFLKDYDYKALVDLIMNLTITQKELDEKKEILIKEIAANKNYPEYKFYEKIWKSTRYFFNPLGTIRSVKNIKLYHMMNFMKNIQKKPLYFYTRKRTCIINRNSLERGSIGKKVKIMNRETVNCGEKIFDVFRVKNEIEKIYLIEKIIKVKNPSKITYLSEKMKMSSLILEQPFKIPNDDEIGELLQEAKDIIEEQIKKIKENFFEIALNELESVYFYNIPWNRRIKVLFETSKENINYIIEKIFPSKYF